MNETVTHRLQPQKRAKLFVVIDPANIDAVAPQSVMFFRLRGVWRFSTPLELYRDDATGLKEPSVGGISAAHIRHLADKPSVLFGLLDTATFKINFFRSRHVPSHLLQF